MTLQRMTLLVLMLVMVIAAWTASPASGADAISFRKQIAPILLENCLACHGAKKAESGYRLDNFAELGKEGESGSRGFAAKNLDESEAFRLITSDDADERMPKDADPLSKQQIALIKRWIEEGAKFDGNDPKAQLAKIVPPPVHPDPMEAYPRTVPVTAMTFSADGKELLVGGYHEVTVWNPADGKLLRRIKNVGQRTYALRLSPDGKTLAVACGAPGRLGELRLFEAASGKLLAVLLSTSDVVLDAAFSPKGDKIAAAAADNAIYVCDVASGKTDRVIESHSDWVTAIAWSRDGTKLVSASRDKTAKVFDLKTGDLQITYSGHGQSVRGVAFHPDGKHILSGDLSGEIRQWEIATGKQIRTLDAKALHTYSGGQQVHYGGVRSMSVSPDPARKYLAASGLYKATNPLGAVNEPIVLLFDWKTGKKVHTFVTSGVKGTAWRTVFHPNGFLVTG
ncbi:MAG: hypothetical protein IIA67_12600, partial [Planctomycetes bacterium]|nr:hypothetical protein [Planctomycetota bacterium]